MKTATKKSRARRRNARPTVVIGGVEVRLAPVRYLGKGKRTPAEIRKAVREVVAEMREEKAEAKMHGRSKKPRCA